MTPLHSMYLRPVRLLDGNPFKVQAYAITWTLRVHLQGHLQKQACQLSMHVGHAPDSRARTYTAFLLGSASPKPLESYFAGAGRLGLHGLGF